MSIGIISCSFEGLIMSQNNNTNVHDVHCEQLLLERISHGDTSAFWQLWNQHKDYLYYQCLKSMGNNIDDAQEALSYSMLRAWEKLPKYAFQIKNVRAWLTRLSGNLCVDLHRSNRKTLNISEEIDFICSPDKIGVSGVETPEANLLRNELGAVLFELISKLPNQLQAPFILRFCEQSSYKDISQQLNISEVTIRKRIQGARALLRRQLSQYFAGSSHFSIFTDPTNNDGTTETHSICLSDLKFTPDKPTGLSLENISYWLSITNIEALPERDCPLTGSLEWH